MVKNFFFFQAILFMVFSTIFFNPSSIVYNLIEIDISNDAKLISKLFLPTFIIFYARFRELYICKALIKESSFWKLNSLDIKIKDLLRKNLKYVSNYLSNKKTSCSFRKI